MLEIRTRSSFLINAIKDVAAGKLVPASFQRPYVWSKLDVSAFWTSIMKGWPIGSMLIWQPENSVDLSKVGRTRLGPIEPAGQPSGIILDGQNRLATFAWSLRLPGDPMPAEHLMSEAEKETWGDGQLFVFDTVDRDAKFVHEDEVLGDRLLIPAGIVFDAVKLNPFLRKRDKEIGVSDEALVWIDPIGTAIRSAECSQIILDRASPDEALEAFRHIAKVGVPMSDQDFSDAMAWAMDDTAGAPAP